MGPATRARSGRRIPLPVKLAIALAAVAALGFLFMRSVRDARSQPYAVRRQHLAGWTVALDPGERASESLLALRLPDALTRDVFGQVFKRAMESLRSPGKAEIPLVLHGEYDRAFAGKVAPEALLAAARDAGLAAEAFRPRCLGYRRADAPGTVHQLYFVVFDAPAFARFRERIGILLREAGGAGYEPEALSPVLIVGGEDASFGRWLPLRVRPDADCVAPIAVQ